MSSKKPRQNKLDPKRFSPTVEVTKKKEKDWSFEDVLRDKIRRRG